MINDCDRVTYEQALKLKLLDYQVICHSFYSPSDKKLFENTGGFSDNSNRHRLSAPVVLDALHYLHNNKLVPENVEGDLDALLQIALEIKYPNQYETN